MSGVVSIVLDEETYGLPVDAVSAVFRIERLTTVPLAAPEIAGLYNLRGKIIPVLSLRRKFDPGAADAVLPSLAVGVEHDGESYAILVDAVGGVEDFDERDAVAPPANAEPRRVGLTKSLFERDGRLVAVLNAPRLFAAAPAADAAASPLSLSTLTGEGQ